MLHLDMEQKVSVLLSALDERYKSIHTIRDRIQTICVWSLGLLLAGGGWLIQSDSVLSTNQRILYVGGITVAFLVLRFAFLEDLRKGFQTQRRTAARIEKSLGMFSPGVFDENKSPLYPDAWEKSGTPGSEGRFFESTCLLLYVGVVFLVAAVLLH
jgi:hypothetical protein